MSQPVNEFVSRQLPPRGRQGTQATFGLVDHNHSLRRVAFTALLMALARGKVHQPIVERPSLVPATVGGSSVTAASAINGLVADFSHVSRFTATAGILSFSVKNRAYT